MKTAGERNRERLRHVREANTKMEGLGTIVKNLRTQRGLPLRKVAAFLDIDQAILSKIEHGKRQATREQVEKLAEYFEVNEEDLLVTWLSDRIVYEIGGDNLAIKALRAAEKKVDYNKRNHKS